MLKQLYIKNFKGFKEELIELKDVNFLVGENSTGKTSLLKLINVLHQSGFWTNNEGFNNNEVELGYFDEIKNQHSKDTFFKIALEYEDYKNNHFKKGKYSEKIMMMFNNNLGNPYLTKVKYNNRHHYTLYLQGNRNHFNYDIYLDKNNPFQKWVKLLNTASSKFSFKKNYMSFTQLFGAVSLLQFHENYKTKKSFKTGFSTFRYKWLAPIRAKAKRTYESFNTVYSPEGDHIPVMIKNLVNGNKDTKEEKIAIAALEKFGKASNLFDKIEVENLGQNGTSTFKINILYNGLPIVLPNVGYGVAQALPLLIEILNSKETLISLQQPEVHLHPRAQAAFGNFIYDSCKKDKNRFLIETHSEYMIDRFRQALNRARSKVKNPTAQVLYFERSKRGNKITAIPINNDGSYEKALPKSYERFFLNEKLNTLHI